MLDVARNSPQLKDSAQVSAIQAAIVKENKIDLKRKRRMRRRDKGSIWPGVHSVRLHNVRRLFRDRYGDQLPDDDAGRDDLWILLHVKSLAVSIPRRKKVLLEEIDDWAPWLAEDEAEQLAEQIATYPITFKSDTLGRKLGLTSADRERLRLWQIRAVDLDANQREERRRIKNRDSQQRHRRASGVKPRAEAASLSRDKPWLEEGTSRRTWYRRRRLAQVCHETNNDVAQVRHQTNDGELAQVRHQTNNTDTNWSDDIPVPGGGTSASSIILSSCSLRTCATENLDGPEEATDGGIPSVVAVITTQVEEIDDRKPDPGHTLLRHPETGQMVPEMYAWWVSNPTPKLPVPITREHALVNRLRAVNHRVGVQSLADARYARDVGMFAVARELGLD